MEDSQNHRDLAVKLLERAWTRDSSFLIAGLTHSTVSGFLAWMVGTLQTSAEVSYAFVGQLQGEDLDRIKTLAVHSPDGPMDNFEYDLQGTPCANVMTQSFCTYPANVAKDFPEDLLLAGMGVESYAGIPLNDASGRPLGIAVLLNTQPMDPDQLRRAQALLDLFRPRAEASLIAIRDAREREIVLDQGIDPGENAPVEMTKALAHAMRVKVAFAAAPVREDSTLVRTLALIIDGRPQENLEYDVRGTPCEHIYRDRPLNKKLLDDPVFQVFAKRIAAELARRRADELRGEAERALQSRQRTESLGVLAGGIAHDFNNLLLSISGNTELCLMDLSDTLGVKAQLEEVIVAVDRAADLCRQMLAYAGRASQFSAPASPPAQG